MNFPPQVRADHRGDPQEDGSQGGRYEGGHRDRGHGGHGPVRVRGAEGAVHKEQRRVHTGVQHRGRHLLRGRQDHQGADSAAQVRVSVDWNS